jgi:hypothetical protein
MHGRGPRCADFFLLKSANNWAVSQREGRPATLVAACPWEARRRREALTYTMLTASQFAKGAGGSMPRGPAGNFPGSNSHGFGVRGQDSVWALISWGAPKKTIERIVKEKGYGTVCPQAWASFQPPSLWPSSVERLAGLGEVGGCTPSGRQEKRSSA